MNFLFFSDFAGLFFLLLSLLKADPKEKVRVERRNEVNLAGGVPGSVLSASTSHEIEFHVE